MRGEENRKEQKRQRVLKIIAGMRLLDDDLMTLVFDKNIPAAELLLKILLERDDLKVKEVIAQRVYKNPMKEGRSIKLDIYVVDETGKVYDVEVQRADKGADVHRARFNSSMIDTKLLKSGQEFAEMVDSYVIFITEHDVIGKGLPMYHIHRVIEETGERFKDGSCIIYVNGSYKNDNDPVGRLMHDFRCPVPDEMNYSLLAQNVRYFKEEGGQARMCKAVEDYGLENFEEGKEEGIAQGMEEGRVQGREEGRAEEKEANAIEMLKDHLAYEKVVQYSGLSLERVKELAKALNV